MAFIFLLLVSLSIHVLVEVSGADNRRAQQAARQNALLGLNVALGELQAQMGPDRRVSARAEILEAPGSGEGMNHPFWTGVWDHTGSLQTWLVSGNEGGNPLALGAVDAELPPGDSESVRLFGRSSADGSSTVYASRSRIGGSAQQTGAYAYWVADEGIKAKLAIADAVVSGTIRNETLISPRRHGMSAVEGMGWFDAEDERVAKLTTLESTEILGSIQGASVSVRERFHDVTVNGYGVLANVRDGGLKGDLTAGLASGSTQPSGQIFEPQTSLVPTMEDPGGPGWAQLRSWVNTARGSGGELPIRPATDDAVGYYPVISSFQAYFYPSYNTDHTVNIHMSPTVVLWNPYDVPLEIENVEIRAGQVFQTVLNSDTTTLTDFYNNWYLRLQNGRDSSGNPTFEYLPDAGQSGFSPSRFQMRFTPIREPLQFSIPNVQLAPGESKVFSPLAGHSAYVFGAVPSSGANPLFPGFRPGWSFTFPTGRVLNVDAESGEPFYEYLTNVQQSRVHALQLLDGNGDTLMDILLLTYRYPGAVGPPAALMRPSPDDGTPIAPNEALGPRILRTYVDNNTTRPLASRVKWLANHNPRAATQGAVPFHFSTFDNSSLIRNPSVISMLENNANEQPIYDLGDGRVPVGYSDFDLSVERAVLFEAAPRPEALRSIGQLMHAPLYRWAPPGAGPATEHQRLRDRHNFTRFDNLTPAYAIGNSLADPHIPLDSLFVDWSSYPPSTAGNFVDFKGLHYDYSYLLNAELWDAYFFSTLPSSTSPQPANPRLVPIFEDTQTPVVDFVGAASGLLVDGAFNVNSTSVEAWKALLASFYGEPVVRQSGVQDVAGNGRASPMLRTQVPFGGTVDAGGNGQSQDAYDGYRRLDPDQIAALADAIVGQVKARGPFVSMADFVNRSLDSSDPVEFRLRGALAQALEEATINDVVKGHAAVPSGINGFTHDAEVGWRTENIPGWLSQADLLARIGSVLQVRSDTFLIRAYGDTNHPITGEVEARVWCEAVVQRMPYYVDASNSAETPFDDARAAELSLDPLTATNRTLGRRFEIVSFRWLKEDEL